MALANHGFVRSNDRNITVHNTLRSVTSAPQSCIMDGDFYQLPGVDALIQNNNRAYSRQFLWHKISANTDTDSPLPRLQMTKIELLALALEDALEPFFST